MICFGSNVSDVGNAWSQHIGFITATLFSIGLSACSPTHDGYDRSLRYPLRKDLIVLQAPPTIPLAPAPPGQLDESILQFRNLGGKTANPADLSDIVRQELQHYLDALFGSPASPAISIDPDTEPIASVDFHPEQLARGSRLYRRHCVQCHGLSGDGRGPTGPWLYPYPRDFRLGVFKSSTHAETQGKPSISALKQILRQGIPGSSMPIFDQLPDADLDALISYVIHLSLRGETEYRVLKASLAADSEFNFDDIPGECRDAVRVAWRQWQRAQTLEVKETADFPDSDPAMVLRGYQLFSAEVGAGCLKCHEDFGRADRYHYDVWGGVNRVRDLTRGEYRWGRQPELIAQHIRHGIAGSGMPGHPTLNEEQVRQLVAFVLTLPAPSRLPLELRQTIYPGAP